MYDVKCLKKNRIDVGVDCSVARHVRKTSAWYRLAWSVISPSVLIIIVIYYSIFKVNIFPPNRVCLEQRCQFAIYHSRAQLRSSKNNVRLFPCFNIRSLWLRENISSIERLIIIMLPYLNDWRCKFFILIGRNAIFSWRVRQNNGLFMFLKNKSQCF